MASANYPQPVAATAVAGSLDERIGELLEQLRETRRALELYRSVTDIRLREAEERFAERKRTEDEFRKQVAELRVKNAVCEERERLREKQGSHSLNALVAISLISAAFGALLPILILLVVG